MGQILTPDNLPDLVIASTTTVTMAASYLGRPTRITIGGQQFQYSSLTTLNFASTGLNGLDTGSIAAGTLYYIYAVRSAGVHGLVASVNAPGTGPSGFTAWKLVAHCRTASTAATLYAITNASGGSYGVDRFQKKVLTSNITSDGAISEWTFSNLVVGKAYQLDVTARMVHVSSVDNLKQGIVVITHAGTTMYGPYWNVIPMQSGDQYQHATNRFIATATVITMTWAGTNLQLWLPSYATLTELNSVSAIHAF